MAIVSGSVLQAAEAIMALENIRLQKKQISLECALRLAEKAVFEIKASSLCPSLEDTEKMVREKKELTVEDVASYAYVLMNREWYERHLDEGQVAKLAIAITTLVIFTDGQPFFRLSSISI